MAAERVEHVAEFKEGRRKRRLAFERGGEPLERGIGAPGPAQRHGQLRFHRRIVGDAGGLFERRNRVLAAPLDEQRIAEQLQHARIAGIVLQQIAGHAFGVRRAAMLQRHGRLLQGLLERAWRRLR